MVNDEKVVGEMVAVVRERERELEAGPEFKDRVSEVVKGYGVGVELVKT